MRDLGEPYLIADTLNNLRMSNPGGPSASIGQNVSRSYGMDMTALTRMSRNVVLMLVSGSRNSGAEAGGNDNSETKSLRMMHFGIRVSTVTYYHRCQCWHCLRVSISADRSLEKSLLNRIRCYDTKLKYRSRFQH